jgi:hypothetical protein
MTVLDKAEASNLAACAARAGTIRNLRFGSALKKMDDG